MCNLYKAGNCDYVHLSLEKKKKKASKKIELSFIHLNSNVKKYIFICVDHSCDELIRYFGELSCALIHITAVVIDFTRQFCTSL